MIKSSGQSISEYALAAALVAIVSIGALTFLANDLAGSMPAILDNIFGGGGAGTATGGGGGDDGVDTTGGNDGTNGNGGVGDSGGGDSEVCIGGVCVVLPNEGIETAGGNGNDATRILADILEQIAQQLEDEGADPSVVAAIRELANKGHDIADAEAPLGTEEIDKTELFTDIDNIQDVMVPDFNDQWATVQDLLNQYGLTDALALVDYASQNIGDIANSLDPPTCGSVANGGNAFCFIDEAASTEINANAICGTSGSSSCVVNNHSGNNSGGDASGNNSGGTGGGNNGGGSG